MKKNTLPPLLFALPILFLVSFGIISVANASSSESPKEIVQNVFKNIIETKKWDDSTYDQYFSKDYVQIGNGKKLNYTQALAHLKFLRDNHKSIKITFHELIDKDNKVVTRHTCNVIKNNGDEIEVELIAIHEIKDGKIIGVRELTHFVKGQKSDEDIGSRH